MTGGFDPRQHNPYPHQRPSGPPPPQNPGYPGGQQHRPYQPPQHPGGGAYNQPPRGPENRNGRKWAVGAGIGFAALATAVGVTIATLQGGGEGNRDTGSPVSGGDRTNSQSFELLTGDVCENNQYQYGDNGGFSFSQEVEAQAELSDSDIINGFSINYLEVDSLSDTQKDNIIAAARDRVERVKVELPLTPGKILDSSSIHAYAPDEDTWRELNANTDGDLNGGDKLRFCTP